MEKKLTKDMEDKLADFPIEDYFGIPSKVVNTKENIQSADSEEQAGSDLSENPTVAILTSQTSMPGGEPSNHVSDKPVKKIVSTKDRKNSFNLSTYFVTITNPSSNGTFNPIEKCDRF
jgi:hypothetical protein